MNLLLRQATIIDPSSPFHLQRADIAVEKGIITKIAPTITEDSGRELSAQGLHVSPGWLDPFAHFCDPGFEYRETLETGARAAAAGGYTDVLVLPDTVPVLSTKSGIEYIVQKGRYLPVTLHPIGAVTKNGEGKELAEMYDMHSSGAVAFSDGLNTIQSSGMVLKALQYVNAIDKTIIQLPDDRSISGSGLMHEGIVSTQLGLPGIPALAEELLIARDIELTKYTGSKIHFTGVSTGASIELMRKAKRDGLSVSCSVTPYHLLFCDEDLAHYDTNLKVTPPLRTVADREALRQAVLDDVIDCIASHHLPQDVDAKMVEFEYAKVGMIGLQTAFAAVRTALPELQIENLVELFSTRSRKLFGLPLHTLQEGSEAVLTLFQPDEEWTLTADRIHSKSKNSPFIGKKVKGSHLA